MRWIFCIVIVFTAAAAWGSDNCVWYETEGTAFADHISPQEAKKLAVARAAYTAVEQGAGVSITGATIIKNSMSLSDIVTSLAEGFVVHKQELDWKEDFHKLKPTEPAIPSYTVTLRSCVSTFAPGDPFYTLRLDTDRSVYFNGEDVSLTARPSRESYLSFFHVSEDGKVAMLYFGDEISRQCAKEGETCLFPPEGFGLRAKTSPGKTKEIETFVGVATKQWFDFAGAFKGRKEVELPTFLTETSKIPSSSRALAILSFEVHSK